ncbi:hypothetical protein [Desertibacillus haloalkaliphilus]|uniref:hypothetical protein n=1 Tax=Desertibacillus haloalkaliphilus TaxID=1328930 RepID=UPI001C27117F|nr:hypothetical protein [Desertibacillus haloalkaliphilus]MBU8906784.1 hypothetical protein [Desertibacillus haloalkaliphilus]
MYVAGIQFGLIMAGVLLLFAMANYFKYSFSVSKPDLVKKYRKQSVQYGITGFTCLFSGSWFIF